LVRTAAFATSGDELSEPSALFVPLKASLGDEPPSPHPAATRDTAIRAPTSIGRRARATDIRLPVKVKRWLASM
jgi:hypothetical protein